MCGSLLKNKIAYIYPLKKYFTMNKFIIAFLLTGFLGYQAVNAQGSADAFEIQNKAYKQALKYYDLQAATVALYNMMAIKPERTDFNDSLALLYFAGERYAQSYLVGQEIVKNDPKRKDMLELVAVSKQNLGLVKEALADYEVLYGMDKNLFYLYQMATLQYQLKRFGECVASVDQIIQNADADKQKVNIRMQNGNLEVPMKAAAYNVKGICAVEMNQKEIARDCFKKALGVDPDFSLAKGNLEALDKPQGEPGKTSGTPTQKPVTQQKPAATGSH
jgi:tetratricopeptide (TPR) repeat protein